MNIQSSFKLLETATSFFHLISYGRWSNAEATCINDRIDFCDGKYIDKYSDEIILAVGCVPKPKAIAAI